jgi:hypothetical protein
MAKQRISYVDPSTIDDPEMLAEFERCRELGDASLFPVVPPRRRARRLTSPSEEKLSWTTSRPRQGSTTG